MKILQVSIGFPGQKSTSGAEKFCFEISDMIKKKNQIIFATSTRSTQNIKTYKLIRITNKILRKLFFDYVNPINTFLIKKIIKKTNPNIVHFHSIYGLSTQMVYTAKKYKPVIITAHDYWSFCYWATLTRNDQVCDFCNGEPKFHFKNILHFFHTKINYHFLSNCTFVAPSTYMAEKLKKIGKFKKVFTIHNGIIPISETTRYNKEILWVGRLSKEKGFDLVGPTLNEIAKQGEWKINVLGDGPQKNELVIKYPHINFLGHQNPVSFYKKASILVVSSIWPDNLPYVILEAMNYGLAIISTKVGGIPDMVTENINGIFYKNSNDFENKITNLCLNTTLIKKFGKNSKKILKEKFNINKTTKKYIKLYKSLIK